MLKEKVSAGATKIKRCEERELYYHQNTLFATKQKQELDGCSKLPNNVQEASDVSR